MSARGPYREGAQREEPANSRAPIQWKRLGFSLLASAGIVLFAVVMSAMALFTGREDPALDIAFRWIASALFAVGAIGGTIAACAEIGGGP